MVFAISWRSSTERHGDFLKAECFVLLGVLLVFGLLLVFVLGFAVLCFCCFLVTPR